MHIALPEGAAEKLIRYHEMLMRANAQFNLTRIPDDPKEAVDRNYLDSLAPLAQGLLRRQICKRLVVIG
ncbi:MAG: class I SAM-dependent methyltransferase [Mailhella sp.]|nr:class I SAM-dependent methyltransferase [Mailhella sp.]